MPARIPVPLLLAVLFAFTACGDPAGTPCEIRGSGFHASHGCRHQCLSRWQVTCPNGESHSPKFCSGAFSCTPGSCPQGQVCYHDDDPFDDRSFCVMSTTCGDLDDDVLSEWEVDRVARQELVRTEREEKEARRARWRAENPGAKTTSPAVDLEAAASALSEERSAARPALPMQSPIPSPTSNPNTDAGAPSLPCVSTASRLAIPIPTPQKGRAFDDTVFAEIVSGKNWTSPLPFGWQFALLANEHGWSIRVFDRGDPEGRVDLSSITPPFHGPANSREIEGWHFRNAANTGSNKGDVNAPQSLRLFEFSPGLIGTGGYRPSTNPTEPRLTGRDAGEGRGWLRLLDFSLTNLDPGARAAMSSMKFQACLTIPHPRPEQIASWESQRISSQQSADANSLAFLAEEREAAGQCGLDLSLYALESRITPRLLELDIDGDDAIDIVYPIRRRSDDARMLALCRAGTWIELLGPEHPTVDEDRSLLIDRLEAWRVLPSDHGSFGYAREPAWPEPAGEVLMLERIEKGAGIFYWEDGKLRAQSLYRMVEP